MKITNTLFKTMLLSTALLAGQVNAAAPIDPEEQPLGHLGPLELDTTDLSNGARSYRGWFENGAWQGDLIEYDVSDAGALTTSIDLSDISPQQSAGGTNWSAHVYFAENSGTGESVHWDTGRKIITSTTGTNQVAFRWANLTSAQQQLIDSVAFAGNATSSDVLDFLRGDRGNEKPAGDLRQRYSVLGDIIHANPEYVAAPEGSFTESSYISFKNANENRAPRLYVGANDGKLHAFDANTGRETWAYVPTMIMHKMSRLAGIPYAHTYFVDGGITVLDAFYGGDWRTVLVGGLGAGARGLYALDVTSPDLSSENIATGNDRKVLWELSADGDDDIGYIFDATTITQLNDGKWYAVNGNGISSVNGIAKLLLVEIETGAVTVISTGAGSSGSPNGLAAPALVDTDNDGKADIAFAGDIDGDLWKFDLSSTTSAGWKLDYLLYDGSPAQPITLAPDVANHPQFGHLVLFGTGKLFESGDIVDKTIQSIYGIWDKGTSPAGSEVRLAQLLSADTDYFGGGYTETVRTFTTVAPIDYAVYSGWKVDLPAGERLLTPPQLRASRLKTTITDPDGFENWLLEATFDEGGVNDESIFDLDRDGKLNTVDRVDGNADTDFNDLEDIPMAWQRPDGNMSQVTIGSLGEGIDTLFLNFLNPPIVPPTCSGICEGGLSGGHLDVDTDSKSLGGGHGGGTDGHVHEYDDKFNRTYIDYLDVNPDGGSKLRSITEVDIDPDEDFIVLIANADWSPGGTLVLNGIEYNVVTYQRMIHKALASWDGAGPLTDPAGNSLILDLNEFSPGEFQMNFDSTAIIGGGLLPTNTGCVNKTKSITKGRWRNGVLILQVVKASHFSGLGGASALDRVTVQTPEDLKDVVVLSDGTQVELIEDLNGDTLIDGTSPAYEMYGGIHATGPDEFLYESSVFWHWDEGECYGDPDWEEVFSLVTEGIPAEVYQEMLEAAGFVDFAELAALVAELVSCTDKRACGDEIRQLRDLEDLYEQGVIVENNKDEDGDGIPDGDGDGGGGGGLSGTPQIIEGGVAEGGMTSGPNFETGRRTWIDILPE